MVYSVGSRIACDWPLVCKIGGERKEQTMSIFKKSLLTMAAAALATVLTAGSASAELFTFHLITPNGSNLPAGQLYVDVTDVGNDQVAFTFYNGVGVQSSITDIYFADGTLLGIADIENHNNDGAIGGGVAFSQGATPPNLPGPSNLFPNIPAAFTQAFTADSDAPVSSNGVNTAGENVMIIFDLINGQTYNDTLDALHDGSLLIGLHIQAFADGSSSSFVNNVPDGGVTMTLLGMAMAGLGLVARRRK
jgi:hypothetical protein